jgi:hypothetical protein
MHDRKIEVKRVWRYSGRHRVLPIEPSWLCGSEFVILEKLDDGAILIRPAIGVKTDGEAARLESQLNAEVRGRDG